MEPPQARPPPPPKPKPRPKPGDNLGSSQDNLAEPPAAYVAPPNDTTVTRNVAPPVAMTEATNRDGNAAPSSSESQPPKPKTVRKKPPPSQEGQPAVPQPLGDSSENLQGDAQPAKKPPAKKKVVKKAPAADANVNVNVNVNVDVPAPAIQANAEVDGNVPLAKPKTAGAKRTAKKPPRPPSTELQTNAAAVRSLKDLQEQEQLRPLVENQPIIEASSPPPDAAPALPKKAPPSKTTRKAAKQPEPPAAIEEPLHSLDARPAFVQPAPIEPSFELTAPADHGNMQMRPDFDPDYRPAPPVAPAVELAYAAQEPDAPTMYPPSSETQDFQNQTANQAQPKGKEQKAPKGGLFSSLRQSFSKPKSGSKSKSKNDQSEEAALSLAGTLNPPFVPAEEPPGPPPMHGSQPLLDVAPAAARAGTIGGKPKSASTMNVKPVSGSTQQCVVIMLDGEEVPFDVPKRGIGRDLTDKVFDYLDLVERDFFGLTYTNQKFDTWFWLHEDKPISKQLKDNALIFRFQVKFYPPDPVLLKEELSRYQLCLQIRQDLYYGKLPCSWVTQALLGSYMVQSEIGDFDESQGMSIEYLRSFAFVDNQTDELLAKIGELHRTHRGLSPAQADQRYLENAKRLELYGVDLHATRDAADTELQVAVCHAGVVVYKNQLRLNRFAWPKVLKISYKKDTFLLRIRTDRFESQEIDCAFRLANHKLAKRLWRFAVESHTFYRLKEPPKSQAVGNKSVTASMMSLISLGSSRGSQFRYSGRTLHQATATLGRSGTEAPAFERLAAKRSTTGSMPNISGALTMSLGSSQNYAAQAANTGSMASLVLPPPRAGVLQTSRSMEMLNSGAMSRSLTLPDGANFDAHAAKSDKNAKKTNKRDKNPPALPATPAPAPLPPAAAYDDQYAPRPDVPLDQVDAPSQPPAPRYTKRTRAKPQTFDDDENL